MDDDLNDRTFTITIGAWARPHFDNFKNLGIIRLCLGWIALSYFKGDVINIFEKGVDAGARKMKKEMIKHETSRGTNQS